MTMKLFLTGGFFAVLSLGPLACGDDEEPVNTENDSETSTDTETDTRATSEQVVSDVTRDTDPDIGEADYRAFVAHTNDFGFDIFNELIAEDTNVIFSGVSVATALGMTYAGARNNTAVEMAAAMHNDLPDELFHAAGNRLALDLASRNIAPHETYQGEMSLKLSLVNALFAQKNYTVEAPFLDTLALNYGSGVTLLDFFGDAEGSRLTINDWVADQTEDKIEDLLAPGTITADTKLVLTNALYFYGSWTRPFEDSNTADGTFTTLAGQTVTVPVMHQTESFPYAEGDGYQIIDLPYDGNQVSMTIVLPEAGRFEEIRALLSSAWLEEARASIASQNVRLRLPKFSFTWGSESLRSLLISLGMVEAFDPMAADFTGMNTDGLLFIFDVMHKAFIGVDEHGTEAAAATAVIMTDSSMPEEPVEFTVDRPFLLFVRDVTGALLFTGQVVDPS